jgi:hypothetical protein
MIPEETESITVRTCNEEEKVEHRGEGDKNPGDNKDSDGFIFQVSGFPEDVNLITTNQEDCINTEIKESTGREELHHTTNSTKVGWSIRQQTL